MVVTGYVPVMVTQGVTRRAAADGSLVAVAGLALAGALATTLAFAVEDLVFALNDWPHVLGGARDMHIYDRPDQYGLILVEVLALYATHVVAGMVIGAGCSASGGPGARGTCSAASPSPSSASTSWAAASSGSASARRSGSTRRPSASASSASSPSWRRARRRHAG